MNRIEQYFKDNSLSPLPDDELLSLFSGVAEFMTPDHIIAYVERAKRFDTQPVHVSDENFIHSVVYWYCLRADLRTMPAFFQAGQKLGLTNDDCNTLLVNLADACKYDFRHGEEFISLATAIFSGLIERDQRLDVTAFQAFLLIAKEDGEITRALRVVKLCMNTGLSIEQSADIVKRLYEAPGIVGYTLMHFYDEIDALRANAVEPALLYDALKAMIDLDISPKRFTQFLQIAAAKSPLPQAGILGRFLQIAKDFKPEEKGEAILLATLESITPQGVDSPKPVTDYFPEIPGNKLILGCLPYRLSKSLEEGLTDLKQLMEEEYTQGVWVFDQQSETWYSMGGRTQNSMNRVRHEFYPYDISSLSSTPIIVKTNPEQSEILIAPDRRNLEFPKLEKRLTGFLTAMPSGADLGMIAELQKASTRKVPITGLIVSSQGVTEFSVPDDASVIAEIAPNLRGIKGQVISELDQANAVREFGTNGNSPEFVRFMKDKLISLLPPGFVIAFHTFKGYGNYLQRQSEPGFTA
ncbi:hypothetical protein [Rhizobium sp. MHM7A]|uniref:hypothetical protein n=1 Tax=Rhizobium sp. MHM7A TaxID=2583233 RepID=UPI001106F4CC|nr:hypothetical protein [Rhizobium sp. MHM7A]TLX15913.1 hypothetical protein FFR93_00945 [Rhizobium sp. MHM7A]